jgi:acid phosphatase family membrane protein YuiD
MMAFLFIPNFFLTLILTMLWCRYKDGRWDARQFIASGGMPSSHSATVTALAVSVGIQEGFRSATFATALVFACVVRTILKLFIRYLIVCLVV